MTGFMIEGLTVIDVRNVPPNMMLELGEYMRLNMIQPVVGERPKNGDISNGRFYAILGNKAAAQKIFEWFSEREAKITVVKATDNVI